MSKQPKVSFPSYLFLYEQEDRKYQFRITPFTAIKMNIALCDEKDGRSVDQVSMCLRSRHWRSTSGFGLSELPAPIMEGVAKAFVESNKPALKYATYLDIIQKLWGAQQRLKQVERLVARTKIRLETLGACPRPANAE